MSAAKSQKHIEEALVKSQLYAHELEAEIMNLRNTVCTLKEEVKFAHQRIAYFSREIAEAEADNNSTVNLAEFTQLQKDNERLINVNQSLRKAFASYLLSPTD